MSTICFKTSLGHLLNYTFFPNRECNRSIVFVHGLGSSQNFYYSIAKNLNEKSGFNCLIFDNYGASLSKINPDEKLNTASINNSKSDIVELVKHLELDNIILVGHSMGGMIVNSVAATAVDSGITIEQLILLAPVHPNPSLKQVFDKRIEILLKEKEMSTIANSIPHLAVGSAAGGLIKEFVRELVSRQSVEGYIYNCHLIANTSEINRKTNEFELDLYKSIKIPVLFILGEEDKTAPWDNCVEVIHKSLGTNPNNVKVITLPKIGHWIAVEAFDETLEAIKEVSHFSHV